MQSGGLERCVMGFAIALEAIADRGQGVSHAGSLPVVEYVNLELGPSVF